MLKWTVANKRDSEKRRSSVGVCTLERNTTAKSAIRTKRRRSSAPRRSTDKENQFTSTPIKGSEEAFQPDVALRDVSNLTPKKSGQKKKKQKCVSPFHIQDFLMNDNSRCNYFKPFEAVDSHIKGADEEELACSCETPIKSTYAPTLPTFPFRAFNNLKLPEICQPNKKAKIDHVNDFLKQILITSPEEEGLRHSEITREVNVSPLVKRLVDLRFSKIKKPLEDSSFINDLSLDKIVDAILDNSNANSDNNLNETREENLINARQEEHDNASLSTDSGFKSSTTEQSHHIDENFTCKCNNNIEKTMINLEETYNERCVDVTRRIDHLLPSRERCVDVTLEEKQIKEVRKQNPVDRCIDATKYFKEEFLETHIVERCVDVPTNKTISKNQNYLLEPSNHKDYLDVTKTINCTYTNGVTTNNNFLESTRIDSPEKHCLVSSDEFISRKRSSGDSLGKSPERKKILLSGEEENFILRRQKCIRRRRLEDIKKEIVMDGSDNDNSFESYESSVVEAMQETYTVENRINDETYCKEKNAVKGTINLELFYKEDVLTVNVFRCEDLQRANGQPVNAYVKVALSDRSRDGRRKQKGTLQRTAVQAESPNPVFDTVFKVPIDKNDLQKMLHVEVWHRDRATRRSEFLGCVSFVVKNAIKTNISGSYPLLPQASNRNFQISPPPKETEPEIEEMCESHSSVDDVVGYEGDIDVELKKTSSKTMLSQQQKDADENLFLRYLELDPTEGPEAGPAAAQRKATGNKGNGRTPFTTTKMLRRQPKTGFGFSVVWTHPPRIEKVEKGLPADKAGILPGDYLIFVDKHNVVMMPEIEILNLIRSFGNQLTLEIFRRSASRNGSVPSVRRLISFETGSSTGLPPAPPSVVTTTTHTRRPSTVCSTNTASVEYNRKKLHIPQVTFTSEKPRNSTEDMRKKAMYSIITREQQYATALQFAMARFVSALVERKDLIGPAEHRILFQNSDELLRITEDILDCLVQDDGDYHTNILLGTYHLKLNEISSAYKKYCSGIKKADCVLANVTKNPEFVRFLQTPAIPRRRPDMTVFIHKPLEHYREILKLFNVILGHTKPNHEDYYVINQIVHELQVTYREMTSEAGLMEPMGEGRPLLSVQDLENRLVFTKCKPFVLTKPGRQWIFGGDLSRVEGRTVRQYWALLFTDILLFAKVSRDRVLFILEDPLPLSNISETFFNVRKRANEFRIIVEPGGGREASSPTVHCGPDLTRTPKKNPSKRCIVLRTPTVELKAVWQNLLQRQIFHVNSGMDGSSYSSPLESPEAPITSSVVTLQSAESLSFRRQSPRNVDYLESKDQKKQIDELIEHKCKQLEKSSSSSKSNAIHLEQWMKGQLGDGGSGGSGCGCEYCPDSCREEEEEEDGEFEVWTEDMIRKRSEELRLIEPPYRANGDLRRSESRCAEDIGSANYSDQDQSPSKSTNTTESQVTVRSSPLVPETVNVCRQCHKTCVTNQNYNHVNGANCNNIINNNNNINAAYLDDEDDWRPLMLMGLTAINPAATLVKLDPFAAPVPQISVLPPTPELQTKTIHSEYIPNDVNCNCQHPRPQVGELILNKSYDNSPDDSPLNDEQPYHSLNSSNLTLRRYGTVSSLERVGSEEKEDGYGLRVNSDESEVDEEEERDDLGVDNEAFNHSSILSWTARAGSYVAEKMAFFERLGEDYRASGRFFERYLKTEVAINGDDVQEEETSGATSGEEIWGTPTSGGELDEPLSSPNYDGRNSPNGDSLSSSEDTELMMDELLMTPPVTGANIRGLLPRRTLEPLMEEEYSDSYTSSSASTPTDPSVSPEQGNGTGDAADECSDAVVKRKNSGELDTMVPGSKEEMMAESVSGSTVSSGTTIHRSESYRRIIEQEDDNVGFFTRFRNRPSMKFVNIERIPPARGAKFLEFFNVRRERKIYETFPSGKHIIKVFSKEGDDSDDVPTTYAEKPESILRIKERQLDRRFWKQLSRRRGTKSVQISA